MNPLKQKLSLDVLGKYRVNSTKNYLNFTHIAMACVFLIIAYLNELNDQFLTPISSSFTKFLKKFVDSAGRTVKHFDEAKFNMEIEALNGPIDMALWLEGDEELAEMYDEKKF